MQSKQLESEMGKVNWATAPDGAEFYAKGSFYRRSTVDGRMKRFIESEDFGFWRSSLSTESALTGEADYEPRPKEWPSSDERISAIAQNGGDGLHYAQQSVVSKLNTPDEQAQEIIRYIEKVKGQSPLVDEAQQEPQQPKTSAEFLSACLHVQSQRGKQYDANGKGERSFAAAASAFNAVTGRDLKGSDVCLILEMVKLVRQYSSPDRLHADSVLDKVSYSALWAQELTKELGE